MPASTIGTLTLGLSVVLASILLVAMYTKVAAWDQTRRWLRELGLIEPTLVLSLTVASEGVLALLLLARPTIGGVALVVWLLPVTAFLRRSHRLQLTCSCFGTAAGGHRYGLMYVRNAAMGVAGLTLAALPWPVAASPGLSARLGASLALVAPTLAILLGRPDQSRFDPLPATPPAPEDLVASARARQESW